jgi:hypothetical protein
MVLAGATAAFPSPVRPHTPTVPKGLPAGQLIVVRPYRADLVSNRVVRRVVPLQRGPVHLDQLVRAIADARWATLSSAGELTLKAAVIQRPGTELWVGSPVRRLRLADSTSSPASISGTRAVVTFTGVTVISDAGGKPAPPSAHRPYIDYTLGSAVTVTSSRFESLGTPLPGRRGVQVGKDSALVAVDSTFAHNTAGLTVDQAHGARLTRVSAQQNDGAGIHVGRTAVAELSAVTATDNNGNGLELRGPLPALVLGTVSSSRNRRSGADLSELSGTHVSGVRTDHNHVAGVVLRNCPGCAVTAITAADERVGVRVDHLSPAALVRDATVLRATATGILVAAGDGRIENATITLGATAAGVRVRAAAEHVTVSGSRVTGGAAGISADGNWTTIADVTVTDSKVGLRIGGHADHVVVRGVHTTGTTAGLVATHGTRQVIVAGLHIRQHGGRGITSAAEQLTADDVAIDGADIGLALRNGATVRNSRVSALSEAVRVAGDSRADLLSADLSASILGVNTSPSARLTLTDSRVSAALGARGPVTLIGDVQFPPLPTHWLGVFALVVLALASSLELLRMVRERRDGPTTRAPAHVRNLR